MKQNMDLPSCKWNLLKVFILICTTLASTLSFGQAGNAPMQQLPPFPGPCDRWFFAKAGSQW